MQRQYTGTSRKIDNCQLGVFLAYGSARGRVFVDRELHFPTSWTEDPDRCVAAGRSGRCRVRDQTPARYRHARPRARRRCPVGVVTADEAFGQNRAFRGWLAAREVPFVLATRSDDILTCPDGRR